MTECLYRDKCGEDGENCIMPYYYSIKECKFYEVGDEDE